MRSASAYPEFISAGYSTCITCHYNGNGGGPISDYGRALWATEFSSRAFYPSSVSDDDLAAQSGLLGRVQLPFWLRAQVDYRGIQLNMNPGSSSGASSKYYQMQSDLSLISQIPSGRLLAVATWGRQVPPEQYGLGTSGLDHISAREYYLRGEPFKGWFVYAGLLEKVYGIRNIDHTSYQRTYETFNVQNNTPDGISESEGLIVQRIGEKWEITLNAFFGNPYDEPSAKQTGASMMTEFNVAENSRLGFSLLSANSDQKKKQLGALHYRQQVGAGSSLLFEYGLIEDTPAGQLLEVGSYTFFESMVRLVRGYNLITTVERYNSEFKSTSPDEWRFGAGFLIFPIQRLEIRAEAVNIREFTGAGTPDDSWALEGLLHVSL